MDRQSIQLFTPAEAAELTGLTLKAVNNAIDKKTIPTHVEQRKGGATRLLNNAAIIYLCLHNLLARNTSAEFRRRLFAAIAMEPTRPFASIGDLKVDLREPRREVARRIKELHQAKRIVISEPEILGGTPVFRRTRIPVHHIARLLQQGATPKALRQLYPDLSDEMIRLAPIYSAARPPRGRPRKRP